MKYKEATDATILAATNRSIKRLMKTDGKVDMSTSAGFFLIDDEGGKKAGIQITVTAARFQEEGWNWNGGITAFHC